MSTRLTKDIREAIVGAALAHRFGDEVKALIDAKAEFAGRVYDDVYRKSDRQKMEELPSGWLGEDDNIAAQFGGKYSRVYFNGYIYGAICKATRYRRTDKRRVLANKAHGAAKVYEATHKLAIEHEELDRRERDIKAAYDGASRQLLAALNAVTTIKRLIETWPEIAPFARKYENERPSLPALPTDQLNKILDLPVAEAA